VKIIRQEYNGKSESANKCVIQYWYRPGKGRSHYWYKRWK